VTVPLIVLGGAVVALGALVLLVFPERPGGVIRFRDAEVSSRGAGLPLVAIGAAVSIAAAVVGPAAEADGDGSAGSEPSGVTGLAAAPQNSCTKALFARQPAVPGPRIRSVELDARDRRVMSPGERQETEFGLVFSDTLSSATPRVLGAMKLFHRPGVGFHVTELVDDRCHPTPVSTAADPGVPAPAALGGYVWLVFDLGGQPYTLLLNSSNGATEVLATLIHRT
jgi:hypothetical protein